MTVRPVATGRSWQAITRLAVVLFALILVTGRTLAQAGSDSSSISIPFELVNRHIVVKVQVNESRPLSFVFDTGAQAAIINLDLARKLELKLTGNVRVGGAGPTVETGAFVQQASFTVVGLNGFSQPVRLALPLNKLQPKAGHDFDGIIGGDLIKEFVVEVDYQSRSLKFHNKESFTYTGPGQSIAIELVHGHPILNAEVTPVGRKSLAGRFVLDLGSGLALVLHGPFVDQQRLLGPDLKTIRSIGGLGAGGKTTGRIGRVAELKIGPYSINSPITLFSQDVAGAFAGSSLTGNIGAQIAGKFRIFLDYGRSRIILEPTKTFREPFDRAFSGLSLVAEGKDYRTFRVSEILEDSPASKAGIQPNDTIASIDGVPAEQLSLSRLNEMLELPVPYRLLIRRGKRTLQIVLTPRRLV